MGKALSAFLITLFFHIFAYGQLCSQFIPSQNTTAASQAIASVRAQKSDLISNMTISGISSNSLNTLDAYYLIVEPSRTAQDIPNRDLYLAPFAEDRRLSSLPEPTKRKMLSLIESRLFKPFEALIVAKYLTSAAQDVKSNEAAAELIKVRIDELVLMNIKKQLQTDALQTNPRMRMSRSEVEQLQRYLESDSRLSDYRLPDNFNQIDHYLNRLNMGSFINSFLRRYLERVYSPHI